MALVWGNDGVGGGGGGGGGPVLAQPGRCAPPERAGNPGGASLVSPHSAQSCLTTC